MEATHKNKYYRTASEARTFSCSWQYKSHCLTSLEFCARSICPLLPVAFQELPHSLYTEGFPAAVGVPLAGDTLCQPCPGECWYLLLPKNKKGKETLTLCSDAIYNSTELQPPISNSSFSFAFLWQKKKKNGDPAPCFCHEYHCWHYTQHTYPLGQAT